MVYLYILKSNEILFMVNGVWNQFHRLQSYLSCVYIYTCSRICEQNECPLYLGHWASMA